MGKNTAPYYALFPPMAINAIGMEILCELQAAVQDADGNERAMAPASGSRGSLPGGQGGAGQRAARATPPGPS